MKTIILAIGMFWLLMPNNKWHSAECVNDYGYVTYYLDGKEIPRIIFNHYYSRAIDFDGADSCGVSL